MSRNRSKHPQPQPAVSEAAEQAEVLEQVRTASDTLAQAAATEPKPAVCSNCPYWLPRPDTRLSTVTAEDAHKATPLGQCRRFPPDVVNPSQLTPLGSVANFPLTAADTVCGEHPAFQPA